jgi:hypothetical protein
MGHFSEWLFMADCVNSSWRSEAVVHLSHGFGAIDLGMLNPMYSLILLVHAGPDARQLALLP